MMVVGRRSQGAIKFTRGCSIENKPMRVRSNIPMVLENRSVTSNTRPLTLGENRINTNMGDGNEKTSAVFQPTGAPSSTILLPVEPPASKLQQNQQQDKPKLKL